MSKIVSEETLRALINKIKEALAGKSNTNHTHDDYVTDSEFQSKTSENMIIYGDCDYGEMPSMYSNLGVWYKGDDTNVSLDRHGMLSIGTNTIMKAHWYQPCADYNNGFEVNKPYTLSFDVNIPTNSVMPIDTFCIVFGEWDYEEDEFVKTYYYCPNWNIISHEPNDTWKRVSVTHTWTFENNDDRCFWFEFDGVATSYNYFYIDNLMLEQSDTPSKFKKHPLENIEINKADKDDLNAKADATHVHVIGDVTNLQTELDEKALKTELTQGLATKSDTGHTHDEYVTNIELKETNIPISSITAPKNSYDENSSENIPNANVDPDTGEVIDQTLEGATLSHKIKVNAGDTYNLSVPRLVLLFVLYYDSSDLMLDMQDVNGMTFDIVMPQGVSYLRIYNPYGYDITGITFTRYDEVTKRLEEMANHNHDNTYYRKELIDQTKFVEGYLNDETGEVEDGNDYKITDFIRVYPNMEYIYVFSNLGDTMCFYDENKNFVESHNAMHFTEDRTVKEITFTPPEGAYYLRTLASFHDSAHLLSLKLKDDLIEIIDDLNFLPFKPREGNLYDKNSAENKPNYGIDLSAEVITPSPYDGYEVTHKISLKGGFSYSIDFKANSYLLMALLNANGNLIKRYFYNNSTTTSHKIKNIQDDCYLIMELRISDNSKDDLVVTEINSMDLKADTDHIHLEYVEDITDLNSLVANGTYWFYMPDEILNAPNDAPREGLSYCLEVKDFDIGWYGTQVLTNTLGDMWIRGNECEEWSEWNKTVKQSDITNKASKLKFTTSIFGTTEDPYAWLEEDGYYYSGLSVTGILETDTPIVSPVYTGTIETDKAILEAWNCISRIETFDNSIGVYCFEEPPTIEIPIQLEVIR